MVTRVIQSTDELPLTGHRGHKSEAASAHQEPQDHRKLVVVETGSDKTTEQSAKKTSSSQSMNHEERVRQMYLLVYSMVQFMDRVVAWVRQAEEAKRIEASKALAGSYRKLFPALIKIVGIGLGGVAAGVALYPRGAGHSSGTPSGIFGLLGGGDFDTKFFDKRLPRALSSAQEGTKVGSNLVDSFEEGTRTTLRTDSDLASQRSQLASRKEQDNRSAITGALDSCARQGDSVMKTVSAILGR